MAGRALEVVSSGLQGQATDHRDHLLAIDLGLRTGIALWRADGTLCWWRSQNFGSVARLRRGLRTLLKDVPSITYAVAEGDRHLADLWGRALARRGVDIMLISAETWRPALLHPRQRRSGACAKRSAQEVARSVIAEYAARRARTLRDDAAEAVLIGLWAIWQLGWLAHAPTALPWLER